MSITEEIYREIIASLRASCDRADTKRKRLRDYQKKAKKRQRQNKLERRRK